MKSLMEQLEKMKSDPRCANMIFETTYNEEEEREWNELIDKMRKKSLLNESNSGFGNKPPTKSYATF